MYALKMEDGKELITTVRGTIYQHERNADTLVFLLPQKYEETDMADCTVYMRYVLPSGSGYSETIEMDPVPYNDEYYQYRLKAASRFTKESGMITLWLTALKHDSEVLLETGDAVVPVLERKNIDEFLSDDDKSKIDLMDEKIAQLQRDKADGLSYDKETRKLQLTADGIAIGEDVTVPSDDYSSGFGEEWEDMEEAGGLSNIPEQVEAPSYRHWESM